MGDKKTKGTGEKNETKEQLPEKVSNSEQKKKIGESILQKKFTTDLQAASSASSNGKKADSMTLHAHPTHT